MARGYPDYAQSVGTTAEGKFLQVLALPPVWFEDNFDSPILKWKEALGTLSIVCVGQDGTNDSPVFSGNACMKMLAAVSGYVSANRTVGSFPTTSKFAISFRFMFPVATDYHNSNVSMYFFFWWKDGTNEHQLIISYNPNDYKWYVSEGTGGTHVNVTTFKIAEWATHQFKIFIDVVNGKYDKLIIDGKVIDISAYTYSITVNDDPAEANLFIRIRSLATKQAILYIDNFAVTYNES